MGAFTPRRVSLQQVLGVERLAYVVYAGVVFFLLKKDIILEDFSSKS